MMTDKTLYERLGGYEGISGFVDNLLPRLHQDPQLGRFWRHLSANRIARMKQLLIDYLCSNSAGPVCYSGRDMLMAHKGMNISDSDWSLFIGHAGETLAALNVPKAECDDIVTFVLSLKDDIVE